MKQNYFPQTEKVTLELIIEKRKEAENQARGIQNAISERLKFFSAPHTESYISSNSWTSSAGKLISWLNGIILTVKMIRVIRSFFVKK